MKLLPLLFACMLEPFLLMAQVQDNFADGDFTANPIWSGETSNFSVSAGQLQLTAPAADDKSYLSTPSAAIHSASWEFYVRMGFPTSGTSLTRVYLVSDQSDLKQSLNGYFVMIGNTDDEVSLYRQTGTSITKIIDGLNVRVGTTTVTVKIKITRDAVGLWSLFVDVGNIGTYVQENPSVVDVTHTVSNYFGVYCLYIANRSALFWFDDFTVTGTTVPDTTPPAIAQIAAVSATQVDVTFSETVETSSAQILNNYQVNNANPTAAIVQADNKTVRLTLASPLTNGLTFSVSVSAVADIATNIMATANINALYFAAQPVSKKDVILSEFMADPSPFINLPEAEYIELYNRSANPINLQNWKLTDGSATATLPFHILMPNMFVVFTSTTSASLFTSAVGVANVPSLNNTGDNIILRTDAQGTIDSIHYTTSWYHSEDKQDGGWSLEIIDPENLCEEDGNWTASENPNGGTPGSVNSVNASNPDLTAPQIVSAVVTASIQISVVFNEKLNGGSVFTAVLEPAISLVANGYSRDLKQIRLTANTEVQSNTPYTLTIANISDCSGNALIENTTQLVIPDEAASGDILLNEILFNPKSGGVDFVEVYNTSNKYINLKKWALANVENETPVNPKSMEANRIIAPKSFLVFTPDPVILKSHYSRTIEADCVATMLPSLNDDEGSIALVDSLGLIMDFLFYRDDFHTQFLKDEEGVSLERVSLMALTNNANNWRSASQQEHFATPGYKNSASSDGTATPDGDVTVEPEIFSPQVPPLDFTLINYKFDQSGKVANAQVLDQQGHLIKTLANNEVLGTEGFFRWDGDRDDGGRARAGYYVAWLEVFDASGRVTTFRKRVVVSFR
jgi:methionine-rich copper-binding protein CopC